MTRPYDAVLLGIERPAGSRDTSTAHLELPAVAEAAGTARRFTRFVLAAWSAQVSAEDADLIVSELVTNALTASEQLPGSMVVLALAALADGGVRIDVWDPVKSGPLAVVRAGRDDEGGRGLLLVDALSSAWGQADCATGTQVWARLTAVAATTGRATGQEGIER